MGLADSKVPTHITLGFTKRLLEALLVPIFMYTAHSMNDIENMGIIQCTHITFEFACPCTMAVLSLAVPVG